MRLFVAVEIGEGLASRIDELVGELRRRTAEAWPRARVTWVGKHRLHLTIAFIGSVEDVRAASIVEALERPFEVPGFELSLSGVGAFPQHGPPRVLWAGISHGREALTAVEQEVRSRLVPLGFPAEPRPFRPHLTLGRVRHAAGLRPERLFEGLSSARLGTTLVDAITLFESRLTPAEATYVPLRRTPLRTPA